MGYARYIGQVGALAVALGVGAAVASCAGIAWAETPDSDSPTVDSTSTPPTGTPPTSSIGSLASTINAITAGLPSTTARTGSSTTPSIGSNSFSSIPS
jgi:hypothetical protein